MAAPIEFSDEELKALAQMKNTGYSPEESATLISAMFDRKIGRNPLRTIWGKLEADAGTRISLKYVNTDVPVPPTPADTAALNSRRFVFDEPTILGAKRGMCRWIEGDAPAIGFAHSPCCNRKVVEGASYCQEHLDIVFEPLTLAQKRKLTHDVARGVLWAARRCR